VSRVVTTRVAPDPVREPAAASRERMLTAAQRAALLEHDLLVKRAYAEQAEVDEREREREAERAREAKRLAPLLPPQADALKSAQAAVVAAIEKYVEAVEAAEAARTTYSATSRLAKAAGLNPEHVPVLGVLASSDRQLRSLLSNFRASALVPV
jgi:hypothetical protein